MPAKTRICIVGFLFATAAAASPPLVVHEWGTFTSFQDEQGRTIGGINVDDEPIPLFVHRLSDVQVFQTTALPARWSQGAPECYPGVTLRLETPVIYFYPPDGWQSTPFDVRATFIRGWLTEFYPGAASDGMNVRKAVDGLARGTLLWKQVRLDPAAQSLMPDTSWNVWLAPRKVRSAVVRASEVNEAEKYLFYRGVGNLDAPLVIGQEGGNLTIALRQDEKQLRRLPRIWLVDVAADGRVRMNTLDPAGRTAKISGFAAEPSAQSQLGELRRQLKEALVAQGLYEDEADAMLETWRLSYFESPGLRVFFTLTRDWTDAHLPLEISTPADITRVMVGRVELVSPQQRAALRRLYELPASAFPRPLYYTDPTVLRLRVGSHSELYRATNRPVPEGLQIYESLGRFRDALLAHDAQTLTDEAQRTRALLAINRFSACVGQLNLFQDPVLTKTP